jgi:hypothetical protein
MEGGRLEFVGCLGGESHAVEMVGNYAYAGIGANLTILNISDPATPRFVNRIRLNDLITEIETNGDVLLVGDDHGHLYIYSLEDPANPVWLNNPMKVRLGSGQYAINSILIQDTTAYITGEWYPLAIVDISDPSSPRLASTYEVTEGADRIGGQAVCVVEDRAYLATTNHRLQILDLGTGSNPTMMSQLEVCGPTSVAASGEFIYVSGCGDLYTIRVANPYKPVIQGDPVRNVGASGLVLRGDHLLSRGSRLRVFRFNVLHRPVEVPIESQNLGSIDGDAFETMDCLMSKTGKVTLVDWSELLQPKLIGTYSEPGWVLTTCVSGSLMAAWGNHKITIVDVSNPSQPEPLSIITRPDMESDFSFPYPSMVFHDSLLIVGSNAAPLTLYDLTDPRSPQVLSTIQVMTNGQLSLDWPLLYGPTSTGPVVIDLSDPTKPVILFHENKISKTDSGGQQGIWKKGSLIYEYRTDGSGNRIETFDVSHPAAPDLLTSVLTNMLPYGIDLKGNRLYMAGHGDKTAPAVFRYSDCFRTMDLSTPYSPVAEPLQDFPTVARSLYVSAGIVYIGTWLENLSTFDITTPERLRRLNVETPSNLIRGPIREAVPVGSLIYSAEWEYGLSIYRHILPEPSTEVTFNCAGLIHQDTRELHFKIFAGEPPSRDCNSSIVVSTTPLVDCRLGCPFFTSEGNAACDETPFILPPNIDCGLAVNTWLDSAVAAIDDQAGDMLRVTRTLPNSFSLESIQPFYGTLCGEELGMSCDNKENRILNDCPIYNLMDGIDGNENAVEATGGFSIQWVKQKQPEEPAATVTPSPTATPTETPIHTPTFTGTATETPTPTPSETLIPTATETMDGDVITDGEINARDLLEIIRQIDGAAEAKRSGLLFDFSRVWKP